MKAILVGQNPDASEVKFSDGQTFQQKLDSGSLTGPTGPRGANGKDGAPGAKGDTGPAGKDATINGYNASSLKATGNVTLESSGSQMTVKTTQELDSKIKYHTNKNLIDNWYLAHAVNQRNKTTYTGPCYTIDRFYAESGTVYVQPGAVGFQNGTFIQRVDMDWGKSLKGQQATLSVLTSDGSLYSSTGKLGDYLWITITGDMAADISVGYFDGEIQFIRIVTAKTILLQAVKLELGDQQTLAHQENGRWVLNETPDPGQESRKCQRYYWEEMTAGFAKLKYWGDEWTVAVVFFPVNMRIVPNVTIFADKNKQIPNAMGRWDIGTPIIHDIYVNPTGITSRMITGYMATGSERFDTNTFYTCYIVADAEI